MNAKTTENPNDRPAIPANAVSKVTHDDGRECLYRPYWTGNSRDGHWEFAYWYWTGDSWRYCGECN
jgi:hypothetical protein